jgi:subtilisin family serine protease
VALGWAGTAPPASASAAPPDAAPRTTAAPAPASTDDGVARVVVVTDANGPAPGGQAIGTVEVEPGRASEVARAYDAAPGVLRAEVDRRVAIASDPYASQQYTASRVRANRVIDDATGDGVVVAVLDSGVQGSHPDLDDPLPGGRARVLTGTTFLAPELGRPNLNGQPGNVDPNGHGTHVGGIIAAARDNGVGIAGLAPGAQLLPVRVLDADGFGWSSDVAQGIYWAHQQGADVINLSLAGPYASGPVSDAIEFVSTDTSRGKPATLVVAAAGNSGTAYSAMWPAAHPRALAVASSDNADRIAGDSSRGTYVDLAAPGVKILSTCTTTPYCMRSGTSMASPVVAAAAALLREQGPGRSPATLSNLLKDSAYDIATLGTDTASGRGRLDVAAAIDPVRWPRQDRPPFVPTGAFEAIGADGRTITVRGRAADEDGAPRLRITSVVDGRRSVRTIGSSGGQFRFSWNDLPGTHRVCVEVLDVPSSTAAPLGCKNVVVK